MQVRAFKLPPLPTKKHVPIQIQNRIAKKLQIDNRRYSNSRERKDISCQSTEKEERTSIRRPNSAASRQSNRSRDSKYSRGSSREKSIEFEQRQKPHYNLKSRVSMPILSAKSWAVYEIKQAKYIIGKRLFKKREVASLTKIMNFITILQLVRDFDIDANELRVKVSRDASCITGTTAQLKHDMEISLYDLYYGMMLPSGNDAAYQIAQIGGGLLQMSKGNINKDIVYNIDRFTEYYQKIRYPIRTYLTQMNKVSKRLGMSNSNFANPHGLSNTENYSCAEDMCKLCIYSMENPTFRKIVRTQFYQETYNHHKKIVEPIEEQQLQFQAQQKPIVNPFNNQHEREQNVINDLTLTWENTNKMLKEEWSGIKTGITPNAGPCLAASVEKVIGGRELQFLVILICSSSMDARWKQVRDIVNWVIQEKMFF